jgi:hypothetical protein
MTEVLMVFPDMFRKSMRKTYTHVKILGTELECSIDNFKLYHDKQYDKIGRNVETISDGVGKSHKEVKPYHIKGAVARMNGRYYVVTGELLKLF